MLKKYLLMRCFTYKDLAVIKLESTPPLNNMPTGISATNCLPTAFSNVFQKKNQVPNHLFFQVFLIVFGKLH